MWGTGSHGAAKSTPEFAQGQLRDFLGLPPLAIVMSLHCFFFGCLRKRLTFPTMFFFVRSVYLCCQETTHWLLRLRCCCYRWWWKEHWLGLGWQCCPQGLQSMELVEPWTKLGRDQNWVLRYSKDNQHVAHACLPSILTNTL